MQSINHAFHSTVIYVPVVKFVHKVHNNNDDKDYKTVIINNDKKP